MDGVSQYVTLRRDLFTTGGLVAGSAATTSLPVASLAAPIITEQEPSVRTTFFFKTPEGKWLSDLDKREQDMVAIFITETGDKQQSKTTECE